MATPTDFDKTVKVTEASYTLLRRIAAAEDRKLRVIIERALQKYAPKIAAEVKRGAT